MTCQLFVLALSKSNRDIDLKNDISLYDNNQTCQEKYLACWFSKLYMIQFKFIQFLLNENVFSYEDIQNIIITKYGESKRFDLFIDLFNSSLTHIQDEDLLKALKQIDNNSFTLQKGFSYLSSYLWSTEKFKYIVCVDLLLSLSQTFNSELLSDRKMYDIKDFLQTLENDRYYKKNHPEVKLDLNIDLKSFLEKVKSVIEIDSKDELIMALFES